MDNTVKMSFNYRTIFSTSMLINIIMCYFSIVILIIFQINFWFNMFMLIFLFFTGIILIYLFRFYLITPYEKIAENKITIAYPFRRAVMFNIRDIDEIQKRSITTISIDYIDENYHDRSTLISLMNLVNADQIKLGKYLDELIERVGSKAVNDQRVPSNIRTTSH